MTDNLHVYSGIFVDEKGQRFLQILESSVDSVFEEVYQKTMPQNPNLFKECLSRVSAWDRTVIQEEMHKMEVYIDSDDVFKDAYISYVKSMKASSQKKILINLPHFNEFLQQYWKCVANSRVMQSGRFFNGNAIDRKIICMDAARDVLYSFLNDDTVTLQDKTDTVENDEAPFKTNIVPKMPFSKPLSHVSLSKSLKSEIVPPFFRGNDDIGENDSIITPNDSISQINVPTRLQKLEKEKKEEIIEEDDTHSREESPKSQNVYSKNEENNCDQTRDIMPSEHVVKTESKYKHNESYSHQEKRQNENHIEDKYEEELSRHGKESARQEDMYRHKEIMQNECRSETLRDNHVKQNKTPSVVSLSTISFSDNGKITLKRPSSSVSHKSSSHRHEHKSRRDEDDTSSIVSGYDEHKGHERHKKTHNSEKYISRRERETNNSPESDVRSSHRKQDHDVRSYHSTGTHNKKNYAASEASNSDCTASSAQNYRATKHDRGDDVSEASSFPDNN